MLLVALVCRSFGTRHSLVCECPGVGLGVRLACACVRVCACVSGVLGVRLSQSKGFDVRASLRFQRLVLQRRLSAELKSLLARSLFDPKWVHSLDPSTPCTLAQAVASHDVAGASV